MTTSQDNVVSNIAYTVMAFLSTLEGFTQKINHVYEESLDYSTAFQKWRSENSNAPESNTFPMFVFRRSALRHTENGIGRRLVNYNLLQSSGANTFDTFQGVFGEFDIDFTLIHSDMNELENFEISYMSEAGQQTQKQFSYQVPYLGELQFFMNYDLLTDKSVQIKDIYYKGLSGKVTIRGFFFVATGQAAKITDIRAALKDKTNLSSIDTINIVPP